MTDIRFVRGDTYHFFLDVTESYGSIYTSNFLDTLTSE